MHEVWGRFQRAGASPAMARAVIAALFEIDVRDILPTIRVPTLILHRTGDLIAPVEGARLMAERIPDARLVEFEGADHVPFAGDFEPVLDEMEEFLTGTRQARPLDRVLATVMFTDIVDSTRRAADAGDRRWRELIERHDELTRRQLDRFRGREVKTLGDGFLATFDGPARAIECACAIRDGVGPLGLDVRAGLHTGRVRARGRRRARDGGQHRRPGRRAGRRQRGAGLEHRQGPGGGRRPRVRRPRRARPEGRSREVAAVRRGPG